jgi:hypothetical protein
MRNIVRRHCSVTTPNCEICGEPFGLARHYVCRQPSAQQSALTASGFGETTTANGCIRLRRLDQNQFHAG